MSKIPEKRPFLRAHGRFNSQQKQPGVIVEKAYPYPFMNENGWNNEKIKSLISIKEKEVKKKLEAELAEERGKHASAVMTSNQRKNKFENQKEKITGEKFSLAAARQRLQEIPTRDADTNSPSQSSVHSGSSENPSALPYVRVTLNKEELLSNIIEQPWISSEREQSEIELNGQEQQNLTEKRFNIALRKKRLEEEHAKTLKKLEEAEKSYRMELLNEAIVRPQDRVTMCPPVDDLIKKDFQWMLEESVRQAFRPSKEHAVEDLEGYYDVFEDRFKQKETIEELLEKKRRTDSIPPHMDLGFHELLKTDSFEEKYFLAREKLPEEENLENVLNTGYLATSPEETSKERLAASFREKIERNIPSHKTLSQESKGVQAELKNRLVESKGVQAEFSPTSSRRSRHDSIQAATEEKYSLERHSLGYHSEGQHSSDASSSTAYRSLTSNLLPSIYDSPNEYKIDEDKILANYMKRQKRGGSLFRGESSGSSGARSQKNIDGHQTDINDVTPLDKHSDIFRLLPPISGSPISRDASHGKQLEYDSGFTDEPSHTMNTYMVRAIPLSEPSREKPVMKSTSLFDMDSKLYKIPAKEKIGDWSACQPEEIYYNELWKEKEAILKSVNRKLHANDALDFGLSYKPHHGTLNTKLTPSPISTLFPMEDSANEDLEGISMIANASEIDETRSLNQTVYPQKEKNIFGNAVSSQGNENIRKEINIKNLKSVSEMLFNHLRYSYPSMENSSVNLADESTSSQNEKGESNKEANDAALSCKHDVSFIYHDLSTIQEMDSTLTGADNEIGIGTKSSVDVGCRIEKESTSKLRRERSLNCPVTSLVEESPNISQLLENFRILPQTSLELAAGSGIATEPKRNALCFPDRDTPVSLCSKISNESPSVSVKVSSSDKIPVSGVAPGVSSSDLFYPVTPLPYGAIHSSLRIGKQFAENSINPVAREKFVDTVEKGEDVVTLVGSDSSALSFKPLTPVRSDITVQSPYQNAVLHENISSSQFQLLSLNQEETSLHVRTPCEAKFSSASETALHKGYFLHCKTQRVVTSESDTALISKNCELERLQSLKFDGVKTGSPSFSPYGGKGYFSSTDSFKPIDRLSEYSAADSTNQQVPHSVEKFKQSEVRSSASSFKPIDMLSDSSADGEDNDAKEQRLCILGENRVAKYPSSSVGSFKPIDIFSESPAISADVAEEQEQYFSRKNKVAKYSSSSVGSFKPIDIISESSATSADVVEEQEQYISGKSKDSMSDKSKKAAAAYCYDLRKFIFAGCTSSSEESLSQMFTQINIQHQSTPINTPRKLMQEKGILEETDLTLIGCELTLNPEVSVKFLHATSATKVVAERKSCIGTKNSVLKQSSLPNIATNAKIPLSCDTGDEMPFTDTRVSQSLLSFLQHEKESQGSTDEHVSLFSLEKLTSSETSSRSSCSVTSTDSATSSQRSAIQSIYSASPAAVLSPCNGNATPTERYKRDEQGIGSSGKKISKRESKERTKRLWSNLEEVVLRKKLHEKKKAFAENKEKVKELQMKIQKKYTGGKSK